MGATVYPSDVIVKEARTFPPIAHAEKYFGPTDPADPGTAKEPLKIEGSIRSQSSRPAPPHQQITRGSEAAKFAARENVDMVDIVITA